MFIITESPSLMVPPTKIKSTKDGRIRMECVLQTADDINRNKRRYKRQLIEEGLKSIEDRVKDGSFVGELDHPTEQNPVRQVSVLYKEVSHRILETGWSDNRLMATVETLRTPNGYILRNLAEDGVPVGFSFRGMGDVREISENGNVVYDVQGPLFVVTWDSVSYPSHQQARLVKINENVTRMIRESVGISYTEKDGCVCTSDGFCFLPNNFDKLVETRVINLKKKYEL